LSAPKQESLGLAIKYARREMRGGLKGFRIFIACLILGVAAIAGVGTLSSSIGEGMRANGRVILGGDLDVRLSSRPAAEDEYNWLASQGDISQMQVMRAMVHAPQTEESLLTELKAVDSLYPLYGAISFSGQDEKTSENIQSVIGRKDGLPSALVEQILLDRLEIKVGDQITVGNLTLVVAGVIGKEPDKASQGMALGPRVIISSDSMMKTGLIQPGSLLRYHYRIRLNEGISVADFRAGVNSNFPDAGWHINDSSNGAPGIKRFVERVAMFLTLVGLTALVVGGVGVGNAVRAYLDGKTETIATLKCLGASSSLIFRIHYFQVMTLACVGSVVGLALGFGGAFVASKFLAQALPVPAIVSFQILPMILAAAYGLLTATLFAVWPLAAARETPAASLFRDFAGRKRLPRPFYLMVTGVTFFALLALAIFTVEEKIFAVAFVIAAVGMFVVLYLVGKVVQWGAKSAPRSRNAILRLALANLHRPGSATASVVLSMGLGLTLFVTVALIEGNLREQVQDQLPENAPAFFFIDIQNTQLEDFVAAAEGVEGVSDVNHVPNMRGRIVKVNGVPAAEVAISSDVKWVLHGDRGLTYAKEIPVNATVVDGSWWPEDYKGKPLISLSDDAAKGMNIGVGDTMTINVMGREIQAEIANLRKVDWSTLAINFVIVFDQNSLIRAPHSHLATAKAEDSAETGLFRAVTSAFPNISIVRMKEALQTVAKILEQLSSSVTATASVTLVSGILVLAGAFAAGHRKRVYDSVILKVLGATRKDIFKIFLTEYALLGFVTSLIASAGGWLAAYLVITEVLEARWTALPFTVMGTVLISVGVTILFGLFGSWRALGEKVAPVLRSE
jgi:putative ABC transport system permease protein